MKRLIGLDGERLTSEDVAGVEVWRVQRPPRPGFRPEIWKLLQLPDGEFQFVTEKDGRNQPVAPAVDLYSAGEVALAIAGGQLGPTPEISIAFTTALAAIHVISARPDPSGGGEPANDQAEEGEAA